MMDSSKWAEDDEKVSRAELNDLEAEQSEPIPQEHLPKDKADEFKELLNVSAEGESGQEPPGNQSYEGMDERATDEETHAQFSGHELSESQASGNEDLPVVPEGERDEPPPSNDLEGSRDKTSESTIQEDEVGLAGGKSKGKRWVFLLLMAALTILAGMGYLHMMHGKPARTADQKQQRPLHDQLVIPRNQVLIFDSFVIPFEVSKRFTYISLSISFELPNREVRGEMIEKKHELRGIIYDLLRGEINKAEEVPRLDTLKEVIVQGVNTALSSGKISEVYITEFLAV